MVISYDRDGEKGKREREREKLKKTENILEQSRWFLTAVIQGSRLA